MTPQTRFLDISWDYVKRRFPWQVFLILIVIGLISIWMYYGPDGILGKADAVGYAVCHRIESRSFLIGEIQFSVCARCTGQYLGAVLGILFFLILRQEFVFFLDFLFQSIIFVDQVDDFVRDEIEEITHFERVKTSEGVFKLF